MRFLLNWQQAMKRKAATGGRTHCGAKRSRPRRVALGLEVLEDRRVPSTGPIDVIGRLPATEYNQFIPNAINYEGNAFKDWGNEPSIAVNPLNPNQIVFVESVGTNSKVAQLIAQAPH